MIKAVVFGSELLMSQWCRRNAVNPREVIMATQPDKLKGQTEPVRVVRFDENVWTTDTYPCEQRVRETEAIIKRVGEVK